MTRRATAADARRIQNLLAEYAALFPGTSKLPSLAALRAVFTQPTSFPYLDDVAGTYALLYATPASQQIKVETLLPRGVSRSLLAPPLFAALKAARRVYPGTFEVYGSFKGGQDAQGRPDNGQGIVDAWHDALTTEDGRKVVLTRINREGLAEAHLSLDDVLSSFRRLGLS